MDVHTTHCCIAHGCKYGDEDCPVATKQTKQEYACEICGMDEYDGTITREVTDAYLCALWEARNDTRSKDVFVEELINLHGSHRIRSILWAMKVKGISVEQMLVELSEL